MPCTGTFQDMDHVRTPERMHPEYEDERESAALAINAAHQRGQTLTLPRNQAAEFALLHRPRSKHGGVQLVWSRLDINNGRICGVETRKGGGPKDSSLLQPER